MASMYGLMRITPVAPDIIRVSFVKGVTEKIALTGWMAKAEEAFSWSARESKSVVEIAAGEITVRVDKRSGAVSFLEQGESPSACGKCRGAESDRRGGKLGIFRLGQERAHQGKGHARYGFSGCDIKCALYILWRKKHRMPLVLSNRGYGIAAAAKNTVLLCDIKTYGQYLYAEGETARLLFYLRGEAGKHHCML